MKFKSQICTSRNKGGGVIKHHKVYALKGNEFYEFNSVPEAAEKTGCCKTKIYKCCNSKLAYTGGYVWSYQPLDIPTEVEEWRDVKGYENLYQVNRKGEVRSSHKGYWEKLSAGIADRGYRHFLLHKDGKRKNVRGCRLVAEAYIPNPDNLPFVNHKDENPTNDCVDNLEWCTCEYNNAYGTLKERQSMNNPKNRPVCMFEPNGTFVREFRNMNEAAKYISGNHSCISRCCSGKTIHIKGKFGNIRRVMKEFNFNSQVCTDRVQSERLLALGLKKETADMCWTQEEDGWAELQWYCRVGTFTQSDLELFFDYIPAWSLHRLIEMVQDAIVNKDGTDDNLMLDISGIGLYDGTIDAIAELIKEGCFSKEYLV